jgi:molybdopterin synthase sulfur carrier subunit
MIKILFFAHIREQLAIDQLSVELNAKDLTVAGLIAQLVDQHDSLWAEVLLANNVLKAVNQQLVDLQHPVEEGDTVAFFPPVTGG